jgi:hypothetical protein
MKPFSQKLMDDARHEFNKRLSRARAVIENAFGIMASRFGVFQKPMSLEPQKAATVTMAGCCLHNFLAKESKQMYFASCKQSIGGESLVDLQRTMNRNSAFNAKSVRESLCSYYDNEGNLQK